MLKSKYILPFACERPLQEHELGKGRRFTLANTKRLEPENQPELKREIIFQTSIFGFKMLAFQRVRSQGTTFLILAGGFFRNFRTGPVVESFMYGVSFLIYINKCDLAERTKNHLAIQRPKNWKQHDAE